jgi:(S)-ureidoglycine aminohydrolase
MDIFGSTRSRVERNYALITPDTHVVSPLIGWKNASAVVHISPEMGARFTQYTATLEPGAISASRSGVERFFYVQSGSCSLKLETTQVMKAGSYAFIPADTEHQITSDAEAKLIVFEKRYVPLENTSTPTPVVGHVDDVPGEPFMGDEDARLKTLLPIEPSFDMAVNLFTYQPGATLPQVEIHTMEHGMIMTDGQGVYRLGDDHFPVMAGDVIWLASYCPQWFVAMGKQPASYLYYKDIHRDMV